MNDNSIQQFNQDVATFQAIMNKCLLSVLLDGRIKPDDAELFHMYLLGQNTSPFFNTVYGYSIECRGGNIVIYDMHAHHKIVFEAVVK